MLMLALSISNCSLLLDHAQLSLTCGPNIPGSYAILFFSIRHYFYQQTHLQLSMISTLVQQLYYPLLFSNSLPTWGTLLSVIWFCLFEWFMWFSAGTLECFIIPSSNGPHFVRTFHYDTSILVALHGMAHSFIELY